MKTALFPKKVINITNGVKTSPKGVKTSPSSQRTAEVTTTRRPAKAGTLSLHTHFFYENPSRQHFF